jgi:hypothetical protein
MHSKKFKYQNYIENFANCPPTLYREVNATAFRWVYIEQDEESFKPVLVHEPDRSLGAEDKTCMGYALSMFQSKEKAYQRYKKLVSKKTNLKESFGTEIAELQLSTNDGVSSKPDHDNYTHFSFHEYEGTMLSQKIINTTPIFDENGNFKW